MSESSSRREFLVTAAAGSGMLLAGGFGPRLAMAAGSEGWPALPPVKIHKVYVGGAGGAWPKPEFDAPAEMAKFEERLAKVERQLGDVKFVGGELIRDRAGADKVVAVLGDAAGVLLIHLSIGMVGPMSRIVDAGLPTMIFSQPFSGHDWMDIRTWPKAGKKVALLATSDYGELDRGAALLRVPARMGQSRLILVGPPDGTAPAKSAEMVKKRLGVDVVPVTVDRVIEAHKAVDAKLAQAEADTWIRQAKKVIEPTPEEILKSARMYLAMKNIMTAERAQAITIKCLGGIPINILGYPCLGFTRLLDQGFVGACEADMDSTLTMLMFGYAFGVPGFITDPLFDTAKNAVIHAHCTAPTKMDGPAGPSAPYLIRNHRDDNKGAALEVEMRVGQAITCAKLINLDTMLISTGKITEITDFDDRGCRTQITTQVANAQGMLDNWGGSLLEKEGWMTQLHRVVFYGDHLRSVRHLSSLMGFKIIEEA
jgi:hypothetical protein